MTIRKHALWAGALLMVLGGIAKADSASSAASSASSHSVGSVSDSIQASSHSSTGQKVAQGEYRLIEVAAVPERPGLARLRLQNAQQQFDLLLPELTRSREGLVAGTVVRVSHEAFGLAFARADQPKPFFLALDRDWQHELQSRPVAL